ncbi:MAG: hypothetical protein JOZ62_14440 [Acidobacteriaceae bacterium]|nr:hypothetical protein [Acidobacteriaceae bacterium]
MERLTVGRLAVELTQKASGEQQSRLLFEKRRGEVDTLDLARVATE